MLEEKNFHKQIEKKFVKSFSAFFFAHLQGRISHNNFTLFWPKMSYVDLFSLSLEWFVTRNFFEVHNLGWAKIALFAAWSFQTLTSKKVSKRWNNARETIFKNELLRQATWLIFEPNPNLEYCCKNSTIWGWLEKKRVEQKKIPQSIYNFPKKKVLQTHIPDVSLKVQSSFALFRKLCVISLEKWTSFWLQLFMFIPVFVYV